MERISIFNYEAFYLDFLEGNLNEEDHALFLKFLADNPELEIIDEGLPTLDVENPSLDEDFKRNLKQPLYSDKITLLNYEHFLISQAEGLLSEEKEKEINTFVAGNSSLEKEKALISSVYFDAQEQFIYQEKNSIKRKKAIILWPYYAAVASVVLAFLIWNFNGKDISENNALKFVEKNEILPEVKKELPGVVLEDNIQIAKQSEVESIEPVKKEKVNTPLNYQTDKKTSPKVKNDLFPRKPFTNLISLEDQKIKPIHIYPSNNTVVEDNNQDMAYVGFNEMENPIEPVTNFIGNKIKKTVDFRRKKKEEGKPSGFFIKIGKLEISRKKN